MRKRLIGMFSGLAVLCMTAPAWAADGTPKVWAAPDSYKINREGNRVWVLPRKLVDVNALKKKNMIWDAGSKSIAVAGARGETVAFQIGLEGGQKGLADVNVTHGALTGPNGSKIPAKRIELFKVYYTFVKGKGSSCTPTNKPSMGQGWYPDALVPWSCGDNAGYRPAYDGPPFAVKAGQIQAVWVDVSIPYAIPAGAYHGEVKIAGADATLKLKVTVRDFDLPRKIHNLLFMNFGLADLNQAGGYWLKGEKLTEYENEVYRISRRHRFTAGNMYEKAGPKIKKAADGSVESVDWTAYDKRFSKVLDPKNNLFGPGEDAIETWRVPLGWAKSADDKVWEHMIGEVKKHWQEKGWDLSRAYVYLADEPGRNKMPMLIACADKVRNSKGPKLRTQIALYTMLGRKWPGQKAIMDQFSGRLDIFLTAGDYYHVPTMNNLPDAAVRGMYQGGEPFQGNETLDADGVAMRSWSWIAWRYGIEAQCYYSMAEAWRGLGKKGSSRYKNNCEIWDQPKNRPWAVSQGVFIYPGKRVGYDLPIVNIRMKMIRRGQTDYEYFWLLKKAGEQAFADELVKGVVPKALSEAAAEAEIYAYGKWSHNPVDWDKAIVKAAERLEALKDKLPREPGKLTAAK